MIDQYEDFAIRIIKKDDNTGASQYLLIIDDAPIGNTNIAVEFGLHIEEKEIQQVSEHIKTTIQSHLPGSSSKSLPEQDEMKKMGGRLFEALLSHKKVQELYNQILGYLSRKNHGMRIRLRLDRSLANLPWEFLFGDQLGGPRKDFLLMDEKISLARYIPAWQFLERKPIIGPLKLLIVIANPKSGPYAPIDVEGEKQRIVSSLQPYLQSYETDDELLAIDFIEGEKTLTKLKKKLSEEEFHVIHYIGHGDYQSEQDRAFLVLEGPNNCQIEADENLLLRAFDPGLSSLRLVVLNACKGAVAPISEAFSGVASSLVRNGIPAVIAMQFEVTDIAAQELAEHFYAALMKNGSVDNALSTARIELVFSYIDTLEWATPVLYMGTTNGILFDISKDRVKQIEALFDKRREIESLYQNGQKNLEDNKLKEAEKIYQEILKKRPGFRDVDQKLAEIQKNIHKKELWDNLIQKYGHAETLERNKDWESATAVWQEMVLIADEVYQAFVGDTEARSLWERAQEEVRLAAAYQQMSNLFQQNEWEAARDSCLDLLAERKNYRDVNEYLKKTRDAIKKAEEEKRRKEEELRKKLPDMYSQLKNFYKKKAWSKVIEIYNDIKAINPNYQDAAKLASDAREILAIANNIIISPANPKVDDLKARASAALNSGNWLEFYQIWQEMLKQNPQLANLQKKAQEIFEGNFEEILEQIIPESPEEWLQFVDDWKEIAPQDPEYIKFLDSLKNTKKKMEIKSEEMYQRAVQTNRKRQWQETVEICNQILKEFPNFEKAKKLRQEAVELRDTFEKIHFTDPVIFICHASEDEKRAAELNEQLKKAGFKPWLDKENLHAGTEWDLAIKKAIEKEIDYFIVLQSKALLKKFRGYVNKEIDLAKEQQKLIRKGFLFIIPVRIEKCDLLPDLIEFQTIDLFAKKGTEKLISAIKNDQKKLRGN